MANSQSIISIIVVVAVALFALSSGVSGQSPESAPSPDSGAEMAPAPSMDCFTPLLNLSNCLTYVEAGSKLKTPETGCCPGLSSLIATSPACLCQLLASPQVSIVGVNVDRSKALSLPNVCKVDAPISLCSLLGYPVSPAPGPAMTAGGSLAPASPGSLPASQGTLNSRISALALFIGLSGVAAAIF